jgi:microcystin-dependent protein
LPLNKLDNFIKNTEGRILYVNPSDLDSTDSITNEGNSLAQPFKTIQRALIEAARFSYLRGNNNDLTEKTTILLFPGEHVIDNRPGFAIYSDNNNVARVTPVDGGIGSVAQTTLSLELDSVFDLTQEDNILYKFNSVYGGVVVPRGTSIVGLDLRKTKLRPKYVPNPTDSSVPNSAIFRITGACYFWQFSLFDGDDSGLVYTNPRNFNPEFSSNPRFSHHKLTCFEYCDGVNIVNRTSFGELTDLDMYYSKVSNAYNSYREIENASKFPQSTTSFAKRAPEWEIVGSFRSDPIGITNVFSGNGTTASNRITVTTDSPHGLNFGSPIKIRGVSSSEYNISTLVQDILSETQFTYLLPTFPPNLNATPQLNDATATVETDTVGGASPYIFNISLRSVWGMNGMHADGAKASGFRSMVVAQFTAVSLQKDDRAFVKYNKSTRVYDSVSYTPVYGASLPLGAAQTNSEKVYHLDQDAIYRPEWESSHIKISNDSFIQIVSVFAIGFTYHFDGNSGCDASITNSNSNFGQIALKSDGYKREAFDKDDHAFVTSIVAPREIDTTTEDEIEWLSLDVNKTRTVANNQRLYLLGFTVESSPPISVTQGYRVGAKLNDELYIRFAGIDYSADIYMTGKNDQLSRNSKVYNVTGIVNNKFTIGSHNLETGEKIIIQSNSGDLPENLVEHNVYYAITNEIDNTLSAQQIKIAASFTYAFLNEAINTFGGNPNSDIIISSRISEKDAGDIGSPIQWDSTNSQWYINVGGSSNQIYNAFFSIGYDPDDDTKFSEGTDLAFVTRVADERSLDEKVYKLRVVIPKESDNAKNPEIGFILQDSSFTGVPNDRNDWIVPSLKSSLSLDETQYRRNQKFISKCTESSGSVTVTTESPHKLKVGNIIIIRRVKDNVETSTGEFNRGYNGSFVVASVINDMQFTYSTTDIAGIVHNPGTFTNNTNTRTENELPTLEKNDIKSNLYIYRNDVISDYIKDERDGVYHLYVLNANNSPTNTFTNYKFTQTPVDLYPQLDRDNIDSNPKSSKTYAKRAPIGDVVTNDLKKSITRETIDIFCKDFGRGLEIQSVSAIQQPSATITFVGNHGLGGIVDGALSVGTGTRNNGTWYNVKLFNDSGSSIWNGATAKVVISGGAITSYEIMSKGSGYKNGDVLYFDVTDIGGNINATLSLSSSGITTYIGDVVQITGDGISDDGYYRINSVGVNTIGITKHSTDPLISTGQYAFVVGRSIQIQSHTYSEVQTIIDGETTITVGSVLFNTYSYHGLSVGNKFRVINSSNLKIGDYVVQDILSSTSFSVNINSNSTEGSTLTTNNISANGYILKHGLSSNEGISDIRTESYSSRTVPFYGGESFRLVNTINAGDVGVLDIQCLSGISTSKRLKLGDFVQVNDEIMRINATPSDTSISVFRGYLGTRQGTHSSNSIIQKIEVIPIEFRRPSILRASGHTFEYLGYGPGNYSTALPQVQIKTLSEREDFLVQAQERSCGAAIYTGMNSKGDTFNGNTKVSAASGQTISYDIPKPTITGQDPSKLSVAFDEITVRERILVEGGTSGYVLSQFDGPVTMTRQLRVKRKATFNDVVRITGNNNSAGNENSGALVVKGGVGIGKDVYIRGKLEVANVVQTNRGLLPDTDLGAFIGSATTAYTESHIGNIQIGVASSDTIGNRSGRSMVITASAGMAQTATNGKFTITSTVNDVEINAGAGKSIALKKTTVITGDLEVRGSESVPPGLNSGTIRANYLEIPNITPVGGIVIWSGNESQLPSVTVNGSVVTMWVVCDGRAISRTTYSALFGIIGTKFGSGNGSSTFNLPDLRNTFLIGSNSDSGTSVEGTTTRSGGTKDAIVVTHDHTLSGDGSHVHGVTVDNSGTLSMSGSTGNAGGHSHTGSTGNAGGHSHTGSTGAAGGHSHTGSTGTAGNHRHDPTRNDFAINDTSQGNYGSGRGSGLGPLGNRNIVQTAGDHSHGLSINGVGDHSHGLSINAVGDHQHSVSVASVADHSHSVSTSGANHNHTGSVSGPGSHTHTVATTGSSGTNQNLPPYYALYYVMRIL